MFSIKFNSFDYLKESHVYIEQEIFINDTNCNYSNGGGVLIDQKVLPHLTCPMKDILMVVVQF